MAVHELQFAYQMESSTTMCTWGAIETVGYFVRNGSEVFTCLMDNTKAFDKVRYSVLFTKLLQTTLPVVYTRVLLFIYVNQKANIRWNNKVTGFFKIRNGVRQGAILSGILYCFYTTKLVEALEDNGYGCWVNGEFCGVWSYSDDTYLIAPSLEALQNMIKTCEEFADSHSLLYSTDPDPKRCKTKCIAFLKKQRDLPGMILCGNRLPWVSEGMHLGHKITDKYDGMTSDILMKRDMFIQRNCELNQEFAHCDPLTKLKINNIYNSHMTGSPLWNLFCRQTEMIEKSWNVCQ